MSDATGHASAEMGKVTRKKDPLAFEIGARMDQAWKDAGFESQGAFIRAMGVDHRLMGRYLREGTMPGVRVLMRVSELCNVSVDWLLWGSEREPPAAYLEWLASPMGQVAPEEARRFLRALPLRGYKPSFRFYEFGFLAWRDGLSVEEAALAARATDRNSE